MISLVIFLVGCTGSASRHQRRTSGSPPAARKASARARRQTARAACHGRSPSTVRGRCASASKRRGSRRHAAQNARRARAGRPSEACSKTLHEHVGRLHAPALRGRKLRNPRLKDPDELDVALEHRPRSACCGRPAGRRAPRPRRQLRTGPPDGPELPVPPSAGAPRGSRRAPRGRSVAQVPSTAAARAARGASDAGRGRGRGRTERHAAVLPQVVPALGGGGLLAARDERVDQPAQHVGAPGIVVVEERDERAPRVPEADVARGAGAAGTFESKKLDPLIVGKRCLGHRRPRAVVDDQCLEARVTLPEDTRDRHWRRAPADRG